MSGISMQKRLEIDCKKVKAMEERKADLLAEIARIDAEIKARRISIDYNTKRWNEKNPNNLWDMKTGKPTHKPESEPKKDTKKATNEVKKEPKKESKQQFQEGTVIEP